MLSIARRSGEIASVIAECVYEKDEFSIEYGMEPKLIHKPYIDGDPGAFKGAYVVVRFKDASIEPVIKYMSKAEIDKHRARSKSGNYGPWVTDYPEMAKKTTFKAVFKWLPISIEQIQATTTDGSVSRYNANVNSNDIEDLVEVEFVAAEDDDRMTADEAVEQFTNAQDGGNKAQ